MEKHESFYEQEFRGNWMKFQSFAWSRQYDLEEPEDYGIFYTHSRDSGLIALANKQVIDEIFSKYEDDTVLSESHNHWAVGWVAGYAIKVHNPDGSYTPAFLELCEIMRSLEDYPLLSDDIYSQLEYNANIENIEDCYKYDCNIENYYDCKELPEDWSAECFNFLWNNYQSDLENPENSYPKPEHIIEFMLEKGYIKPIEQ